MQKIFNWSKFSGILGTILLLGAIGAPFLANSYAQGNTGSIENVATNLDALSTDVTALQTSIDEGVVVNVEEGSLTQEIRDKLFEDDAWESEAEVLAMEELEDDDYEELVDEIDNIDDEDDIDYVKVEDIVFRRMDASDKDGIVIQLLKVKYDNDDDDNEKKYFRVKTTIEDGEVEKQEFFPADSDSELLG